MRLCPEVEPFVLYSIYVQCRNADYSNIISIIINLCRREEPLSPPLPNRTKYICGGESQLLLLFVADSQLLLLFVADSLLVVLFVEELLLVVFFVEELLLVVLFVEELAAGSFNLRKGRGNGSYN